MQDDKQNKAASPRPLADFFEHSMAGTGNLRRTTTNRPTPLQLIGAKDLRHARSTNSTNGRRHPEIGDGQVQP